MFSHNWGGKEATLSAALEWATLARSTNEAQHFAEAGRKGARKGSSAAMTAAAQSGLNPDFSL